MKKRGILNAALLCELTKLRHLDQVMICDVGYPIPRDANWVDVSLVAGVPSMRQVLEAVLSEMVFESYTIVDNMREGNPDSYAYLAAMLQKLPHREVPFDLLREQARECKLYIRTGETGRRSNILLVSASGVPEAAATLDITPSGQAEG